MTNFPSDETFAPDAELQIDLDVSTDEVGDTHVVELLRRAAQLASESGTPLETFVSVAYTTFLDSNPDLREQLAEARMMAEVAAMRSSGRVGQA